jgi:hypothetical protein
VSSLTIEEAIQEYREASVAASIADERRKVLGELVLRLMGPDQKSYRFGALQATRVNKSYTVWDGIGELLVSLSEESGVPLIQLLSECTEIRKKRLLSWIGSLPDGDREIAQRRLDQHMSKGYGKANLSVSQIKGQLPF